MDQDEVRLWGKAKQKQKAATLSVNSMEKTLVHLKILNRTITKNYPALKSKPCIRSN